MRNSGPKAYEVPESASTLRTRCIKNWQQLPVLAETSCQIICLSSLPPFSLLFFMFQIVCRVVFTIGPLSYTEILLIRVMLELNLRVTFTIYIPELLSSAIPAVHHMRWDNNKKRAPRRRRGRRLMLRPNS